MRNFTNWLDRFKSNISDYGYYADFKKIHRNVKEIKAGLDIMNSLVGSKNIEAEFEELLRKHPECLKCIPRLLAVRESEIYAADNDGEFTFSFREMNNNVDYKAFMRKTGLFDLLENRIANNLVDYVTGVETGLDSNGRKNRCGSRMESIVESYLKKTGCVYYTEMKTSEITKNWGVDLSAVSNEGKNVKKFDFVVKTATTVYAVEVNFYASGGSKLNETARSYKTLALEAKNIPGFEFVWITDGNGWKSARNNLEETFDVMEHIYNIDDLKNGVLERIFIF